MSARVFIEAGLFLGLFILLSRHRRLMEHYQALGPAQRILLVALLAAVPVGQVINNSAWTYPWVGWAMYTDRLPGDVTYLEYSAALANGEDVDFPVARMFSRMGKKVVWKLKALERGGAAGTCDKILTGLAQRYNREHAGNPAITIRIWDCVVPMQEYRNRASVRRTLRREMSVAGSAPVRDAAGHS